jgi:sulfate permease, SulP family
VLIQSLRHFLNPFDGRFEDLKKGNIVLNVARDFTAGLVVAMIAIPLAMGFAMASGLRPEQGIVGGAVAGFVGAMFGGSKYQVYGPTAAFIPIIGAIMAAHDHAFLVVCSLVAGLMLALGGFLRVGRFVRMVPHSIVVGFTIGIAVTIALSQGTEILGVKAKAGYDTISKLQHLFDHWGVLEIEAVALAIGTVLVTRLLLKISIYIPAPLVALAIGILLTQTVLADEHLTLVRDKFGAIPATAIHLALPGFQYLSAESIGSVLYNATAIVFVAAIESLLCSRMADRLAGNKGIPYDPDKELWGQAHVMFWVPLLNGFPHTGALARTATNIKLGALSPLAGVFKCFLKLGIAFYLARYLELVPMACIGGILLFVAMNMVKRDEVDEVVALGKAHLWLMVYTALAVILMDFLRGVLSALVIYGVWQVVARGLLATPVSHKAAHKPALRAAAHATNEEVATRASLSHVRAVLGDANVEPRRPTNGSRLVSGSRAWLSNIRRPASISRSAYVHGQANVIGRVVLGDHVHIAAGASVRADEGAPFFIGSSSNVQDGVVIHALKDRHVLVHGERWAVYVGSNVSMAHDALVHGPCFIGDDTFIGFKAVVHDAVVGARCFVGIGAVVVGVEVAEQRYVPPGAIVDTQEKANALAAANPEQRHFNDDVVEVNRGLAVAYREHAYRPRDQGGHGSGEAIARSRGGPSTWLGGAGGHGKASYVRLDRDDTWAPPKPASESF